MSASPMDNNDNSKETMQKLLDSGMCKDLPSLLDHINSLLYCNIKALDSITSDLIDTQFLEEIKKLNTNNTIFFGKSLRDLKCIIFDENSMREHEILLQYLGPKRLVIVSVKLPHSSLQDREYESIEEIVCNFKRHVADLAQYFHELEKIDRYCTVMEPLNPTFKEDFRRILLDDRTWLHVEVTPQGLATNVHLVGHCAHWQDKLQVGILNWDHDKDIIENIMRIFDISDFPGPGNKSLVIGTTAEDRVTAEAPVCSICLCSELPDDPGVPQPLCQNTMCGVYFHRNCLFQWLVACAGGRPPAFGVATGGCPACLQPITCNQKDS